MGLSWWSSGKESALQYAGDTGSIPRQGTGIPYAAGQLSLRATTTELAPQLESPHATNYRAHVLWNPHSTTKEKPVSRK